MDQPRSNQDILPVWPKGLSSQPSETLRGFMAESSPQAQSLPACSINHIFVFNFFLLSTTPSRNAADNRRGALEGLAAQGCPRQGKV